MTTFLHFLQHAIREWWGRRKHEKLDSVLDYAKGRFGERFVDDVKALQGVVYVFLPVPVFWSLFDQQVSPVDNFTNILRAAFTGADPKSSKSCLS